MAWGEEMIFEMFRISWVESIKRICLRCLKYKKVYWCRIWNSLKMKILILLEELNEY